MDRLRIGRRRAEHGGARAVGTVAVDDAADVDLDDVAARARAARREAVTAHRDIGPARLRRRQSPGALRPLRAAACPDARSSRAAVMPGAICVHEMRRGRRGHACAARRSRSISAGCLMARSRSTMRVASAHWTGSAWKAAKSAAGTKPSSRPMRAGEAASRAAHRAAGQGCLPAHTAPGAACALGLSGSSGKRSVSTQMRWLRTSAMPGLRGEACRLQVAHDGGERRVVVGRNDQEGGTGAAPDAGHAGKGAGGIGDGFGLSTARGPKGPRARIRWTARRRSRNPGTARSLLLGRQVVVDHVGARVRR